MCSPFGGGVTPNSLLVCSIRTTLTYPCCLRNHADAQTTRPTIRLLFTRPHRRLGITLSAGNGRKHRRRREREADVLPVREWLLLFPATSESFNQAELPPLRSRS